jgi:hypothetical protein
MCKIKNLFLEAIERKEFDISTIHLLMSTAGKKGNLPLVERSWNEFKKLGKEPFSHTQKYIVTAFLRKKKYERAISGNKEKNVLFIVK